MRLVETITISCVLVGIALLPDIRLFVADQLQATSWPGGIEKDATTSPTDSVGWTNLFPKDGLGRDFEFYTEDKSDRGNQIFTVTDTGIDVLYDWADSTAPFAIINTTREYSNYNLELEYKWGERKFKPRHRDKRDAGILFHVHNEKVVWPSSLECQVQEDDTGDLWVVKGPEVNVVNPDGSIKHIHTRDEDYQRNIKFKNAEVEGWNHIRLEIRGAASGKFYVNGELVNEISDMKDAKGNKLEKGSISLQGEGAEISYRNVRIQVLKE